MTDYSLEDDLRLARDLADMAHVLATERFRAQDLVVETKPDHTPVTDADRAVEQAIRATLRDSRPGDSVLGEEFGSTPGLTPGTASGSASLPTDVPASGARQWIIDPIDGTANFLRGVPVWGTLIALAVDSKPVVGVASCPALGRCWWAAKGMGAWAVDTNAPGGSVPRRISVSGVQHLADASLSYNSLKGWQGAGRVDALLALSESVWRTRAYGDLWAYMLLAEGALDIVAEHDLQLYDLAALIPIIEEAGGRFTSTEGLEGGTHGSALATNALLHNAVLDQLRS